MVKKIMSFVISFIMIFLMFPTFTFGQDNQSPRVEAVRGDVFVQRAGGHSTTAVYRGMDIHDGDVIITGIESTATVVYYGQMIIMGELTTLSINSVW